jgi:hypothetical protein
VKSKLVKSPAWVLALVMSLVTSLVATGAHAQSWDDSSSMSVSAKRAKKKKKDAEPENTEIAVPVPQSILNFESLPKPVETKTFNQWEVSVSNWQPRSFSEGAYVAGAGNFESVKIPMISLNVFSGSGGELFSGAKWTPKFGGSFNQLARSGALQLSASSFNVEQTTNIISARAGVELTSQNEFWGVVKPFVDLSLLPSFALTTVSELSDGSQRGLLAFEEVAGVSVRLGRADGGMAMNRFGLELGVQAIQGTGSNSLTGLGVIAGTRVDL